LLDDDVNEMILTKSTATADTLELMIDAKKVAAVKE
jgi:hypothetical protein